MAPLQPERWLSTTGQVAQNSLKYSLIQLGIKRRFLSELNTISLDRTKDFIQFRFIVLCNSALPFQFIDNGLSHPLNSGNHRRLLACILAPVRHADTRTNDLKIFRVIFNHNPTKRIIKIIFVIIKF